MRSAFEKLILVAIPLCTLMKYTLEIFLMRLTEVTEYQFN